jgi:hypothetical protein
MRSIVLIVADVVSHEAFRMPLIEDDDMIKEIPAATANEALRDSVLPWTTGASSFGLDAEIPDCADNYAIEVGALIEDQMLR